MNRQVVELGFILNQIPNYKFSLDMFSDRLRFQKMVYLLQAFGIYLGYDFSWYLRGPYCPSLTVNGFALESIYGEIPAGKKPRFIRSDKQELFVKFQDMVKDKSTDQLEILASLHYQKLILDDVAKIKEAVINKRPRISKGDVDRMWDELGRYGLV